MLRPVRTARRADLAIDLGTANARASSGAKGAYVERPSLLDGVHPIRGGAIVDIGAASDVLAPLVAKSRRWGFLRPQAIACVPTDATADEREALEQATIAAGARDVTLVLEPLAAAIGAGLDLSSPYAQMLIDFGDGITDAAIIRSGEVISSWALRCGCSDLRRVVADALNVDDTAADLLMRRVCNDVSAARANPIVLAALQPAIERLTDFVCDYFFSLPDSISVEVIETGITATGGGALLPMITSMVALQSGVSVNTAADPLHAVIRGAGAMLRAA